MNTIIIVWLVIISVIAIPIINWGWGGYNTLISRLQNIKARFSNIKTEYQRRADLFYNLVEATKSHANFEKDTLTQVIAMRQGNLGSNPKEAIKKNQGLNELLSKLMVVIERYPKLRSTEQYQLFMEEVRSSEDRINTARIEYNDTVREYNLFVVSFPSNILAKIFSFKEEEYFINEPETSKGPKMDLKL